MIEKINRTKDRPSKYDGIDEPALFLEKRNRAFNIRFNKHFMDAAFNPVAMDCYIDKSEGRVFLVPGPSGDYRMHDFGKVSGFTSKDVYNKIGSYVEFPAAVTGYILEKKMHPEFVVPVWEVIPHS